MAIVILGFLAALRAKEIAATKDTDVGAKNGTIRYVVAKAQASDRKDWMFFSAELKREQGPYLTPEDLLKVYADCFDRRRERI